MGFNERVSGGAPAAAGVVSPVLPKVVTPPGEVFNLIGRLVWTHTIRVTSKHPLFQEIMQCRVYQDHATRAILDVSTPTRARETLQPFLKALVVDCLVSRSPQPCNIAKVWPQLKQMKPESFIAHLREQGLTQLTDCLSTSDCLRKGLPPGPMMTAIRDSIVDAFPAVFGVWDHVSDKMRIEASMWDAMIHAAFGPVPLGLRHRFGLMDREVLLVDRGHPSVVSIKRQVSVDPELWFHRPCADSFLNDLKAAVIVRDGPRHTGGRNYRHDVNPLQSVLAPVKTWYHTHPLLIDNGGHTGPWEVWRGRRRLFVQPSGCVDAPPYPVSPVTNTAYDPEAALSSESGFIINMVMCLFGNGVVEAITHLGKRFYVVAHQMPLDEGDYITNISVRPHLHPYEVMSLLTIREWMDWYHQTRKRLNRRQLRFPALVVKIHIPGLDYMVEAVGHYFAGRISMRALQQMLQGVHKRTLAFRDYLGRAAKSRDLGFSAISPYDGISRIFQRADGTLRPVQDVIAIFHCLGAPHHQHGELASQRFVNVLAATLRKPDELNAVHGFDDVQPTPGVQFINMAWREFPVEDGADVDFTVLQQFGNVAVLLTTNLLQQVLYRAGIFPFLMVYPDSELPPLVELLKLLKKLGLNDCIEPIKEALMVYLSPMGAKPSLYQSEKSGPLDQKTLEDIIRRCLPVHRYAGVAIGEIVTAFTDMHAKLSVEAGTVPPVSPPLPSTIGMYGCIPDNPETRHYVPSVLPSTVGMYGSMAHNPETRCHALAAALPQRRASRSISECMDALGGSPSASPQASPKPRRRTETMESKASLGGASTWSGDSGHGGSGDENSRPTSPGKPVPDDEVVSGGYIISCHPM